MTRRWCADLDFIAQTMLTRAVKRVLFVGLIGLVSAWGCGSDDSEGGGTGGSSGGSAGSSAATGGDGGSAGSTGASGGSGGSAGTSGGSGGSIEDGGMEASLDVYVYTPCNDVCDKVKDSCSYTPMELEDCIQGCTDESLGMCQTELKAYVACVNGATSVECVQGNPTSSECMSEAQAYGQCAMPMN